MGFVTGYGFCSPTVFSTVMASKDGPIRVAVALLKRDGRWLVARRRENTHLGGLWEFPGGKIESHESPEAAAVRELFEECAITARSIRTLRPVLFEYPEHTIELTPIVCEWVHGEPRPIGNEECRWVTYGELLQLEMPAANAEIIRLALMELP